jgi:hypothetical protein
MVNRRTFKSDVRFLEKISMGATGTIAVFNNLREQGHTPIELERGSRSFKIWKTYITHYGAAYLGDAPDLLKCLPDESIDLVLTSPPFALLRQKEYGNMDQDEYVDWLLSFTIEVRRVLKETGSFVLDLGGA